ncbi:MAG: bacteriophage abortive infection AbiH family protein [Ruminococcus sp.]|jgi:hypothetical protein|nr:bacteriophage abortive infection AbiH family protein [Ruminococcus sp.]
MANITFILGNGFDLNLGLKTRYTDFYPEYIKMDVNDSDVENKDALIHFKSLLKNDQGKWENWSDFELAIGKYSDEFEKAEDLIGCIDDFTENFKQYLKQQSQRIDWSMNSTADTIGKSPFSKYLFRFYDYTSEKLKNRLVNFNFKNPGNNVIDILQLNYTDTFDTIFSCFKSYGNTENNFNIEGDIKSNLHIHGDLSNSIVMGVDNIGQIINKDFHKHEALLDVLLKENYAYNISQYLNANLIETQEIAVNAINSSNNIIAFGTSIGKTDKRWWKIIGNWLKRSDNYRLIFINSHKNDIKGNSQIKTILKSKYNKEAEEKLLQRFYGLAEWSATDIIDYSSQITVDFNTDLFKFDLGLKDESKTLQPA